ncbi:MAG TPA: DUF6174 domain-containing protein [Pirellulales bacterium]|jgi:hypothetical protein|nr:DUF6174 domain-containing protein [Pirellulales bacterium]
MPINGFDDERRPVVGRRSRISLRFVAGAIVLGVTLGLVATVVVLLISSRGQLPRMTAADFKNAERHWAEFGPASYEMNVEQSLGLSGKIHVEVRQRQVTAMTINGEPAPPRLWDNWSVAGLFEIIQLDLDRNTDAAGQSPVVFQQAEFDPDTGLPRVYRRTEMSGGQTVEWRIRSFRALQ